MTEDERIEWIDKASYEDLLQKWRFAPVGDPFFVGEVGDHYFMVMKKRRLELSPDQQSNTSKQVGWKP